MPARAEESTLPLTSHTQGEFPASNVWDAMNESASCCKSGFVYIINRGSAHALDKRMCNSIYYIICRFSLFCAVEEIGRPAAGRRNCFTWCVCVCVGPMCLTCFRNLLAACGGDLSLSSCRDWYYTGSLMHSIVLCVHNAADWFFSLKWQIIAFFFS